MRAAADILVYRRLARFVGQCSLIWLATSSWGVAQGPSDPSQSGAEAATARSATERATAATGKQIQELIQKLGSDQFQERESASAALLAIGEPALIQLAAAERGKVVETSSRARAIRERIERDRFETTATQFKRDPDPKASYGLPGWRTFSQVAGTSRPAKRLFLEMLEQRPIVALCLESLGDGPGPDITIPDGVFDGLPGEPVARLRLVVARTCTEIRHNVLVKRQVAQPGDLIAILVAGQVIDDVPAEVHEVTRLLCNMQTLNRIMQMPGAGPSARKLMGGWFKKAPLSLSAEVFNWSRLYRILEGREMVKRVLDAPTDVESKADAFVYLCVQGTRKTCH